MVDTIFTLIASIVALIGAMGSAGIAAWVVFYSDHRKHLNEVEKAMAKYRDPLMLAAYDLERKLWVLAEVEHLKNTRAEQDYLHARTYFLLGQYFSWVYILRNETQLLRFSETERTKLHTKALAKIADEFSERQKGSSQVLRLRTGDQEALGEEMTTEKRGEKEGQRICIGYHTFQRQLAEGKLRKPLFLEIKRDIDNITLGRMGRKDAVDRERVLRLQHLLADLVGELDPDRLHHDFKARREAIKSCKCNFCAQEGE